MFFLGSDLLGGGEEIFHDGESPLLARARQLADSFKGPSGASDGAAAFLASAAVGEQLFHGDLENGDELFDLFGAQGDGVAFPVGVGGLGEAQLLGDLGLREAGGGPGPSERSGLHRHAMRHRSSEHVGDRTGSTWRSQGRCNSTPHG